MNISNLFNHQKLSLCMLRTPTNPPTHTQKLNFLFKEVKSSLNAQLKYIFSSNKVGPNPQPI